MTTRTPAGRRALTAAGALCVPVAVVLAGCGDSSPSAAGPVSRSRPAAPARSPAATGAASAAPSVRVPKYVAKENARKSVRSTACVAEGAKGWRIEGTASNRSGAAQGYNIVVDFVTTKGNTVMDTKIVKLAKVAAGATRHWSATGAAGQSHITCVIRQALTRPS